MSILALLLIAENKITKAPFLDLGNCGLVNYLPEELLDCVWLEELNLGSSYFDRRNSKMFFRDTPYASKNIFSGEELYELKKLTKLKELHLNNCSISNLQFLEQLTDLQTLDLNDNQIVDIKSLEMLTGLKTLNLHNNQIIKIAFLKNLKNIENLNLGDNTQISDIQSLGNLTSLQDLYLKRCKISNIQFLENLTDLQVLNLCANQVSDIQYLGKLKGLKKLDIRSNQLNDIKPLETLTSVKTLHLGSNPISNFQPLSKLIYLQGLFLNGCKLSNIAFLENLTCLQMLDLSSSQIDTSIHYLENLTNLKSLYLGDIQLSNIAFLEKLKGLQTLHLKNNQLSNIHSLECLISLQSIYISNNHLSSIHSLGNIATLENVSINDCTIKDIRGFEKLTNLKTLNLSNNQLSDIKPIEKLTSLKTIDLSYNQISDISCVKKICNLSALEQINIRENPLELPVGLALNEISALRSYFKDGEAGVTNKRNVKLLFMGDGCAGKSTLYQHLETGVTPQEIAVNDRTHGIVLGKWSEVLPDVEVRVWDFGGQDIFHSTHRLFLGQGAIYVVVWTKQTNKKCTQGEQHPLRYWLDFIADYGRNSTVLLVENGIDGQFDSAEFPDDTTLEQLVEEYKQKGIHLDTSHYRIDCKNDTRNVKKLKAILQNEIEQLVEDYPIKDFPANWYAVQQNLEQLKLVHKTITWEDYQAICDQENISDATALVKYLDQSGVVSYYPDLFEQQVILQTDWILEAMYAFLQLENNPIARQGGKLREEDFRIVWGTNYTEDEQALFKSYMLKSEVMARPSDNLEIQRDYEYLIPALFKPCKAHEKVNWANEPHYIAIQFKFIYLAIIQRLQVKILTHCHVEEEESFYNNRISFTDKVGRTAHIELLVEEKELRIHAEHQDLYRDILTELNSIYPLDRLKVIERIKGQEDKEMDSRKVQHGKEYGFEKKGFLNEKEEDKKAPQQSMTMIQTDKTPEIFFSYAWGDDKEDGESREQIINELYKSLKSENYSVIRDKVDLGYKDSILSFMERIGKGDVVVVALSDKYFKSPYCMFELYEVYRNAKFEKKEFVKSIFPIRVESIALGDPKVLSEYLNHWKTQKEEKEAFIMKFLGQTDSESFKNYERVKNIHSNFLAMVTILKDMNLLNKDILSQDNFAEIKRAIIKRTED